jgi:hypothetical protein
MIPSDNKRAPRDTVNTTPPLDTPSPPTTPPLPTVAPPDLTPWREGTGEAPPAVSFKTDAPLPPDHERPESHDSNELKKILRGPETRYIPPEQK